MKPSQILWLCYAGMVCVAVGANLQPVYLTTYSETFGGLGEEDLGRVPAILFAGFVVGILLSGPLADRFGARLFSVTGFGISALGLGMLALSQTFAMVLTASAVIGLGAGVLDMVMSPVVSAICLDNRAGALNRLHAFYCIGAVGTVVVASAGLRLGLSWRWVTMGFAVVPAVLMIAFAGVKLPPLVHPDEKRQGLRSLVRFPRFYVAMIAIVFAGATEAGMAQWLPAYSERILGYSKASGGMMLAAFSLAMGIGRLVASREFKRIGPHALVGAAGSICAGLYLVGAVAPSAPVALAACVLVGLGCSVLWPSTLGITADRVPQGGATMFAMMAAAGNVGCLAIPWAEGVIAEHTDLRIALLAGSCCPLILALMMWPTWLADRKANAR